MHRPARLLVLFSFALAACSSDSDDDQPNGCTEIGCSDGLEVSFVASSWPAGSYRLDVTADGVGHHCETTLPLTAEPASTCSSGDLLLEVSGSALPADQHAIRGMRLLPLAETVVVTLSRDGLPLATQTYYPTYETVQPNGPACGPTCTAASDSLVL